MRKVGYEEYKGFLEALLNQLRIGFGRDNILAFAVFGSVARGEAKPHSDIDILVVHKELAFNPMHKFVDLLFKMKGGRKYRQLTERGLQPEPYPIFMTEGELWRRPHILLDVLEHGIILYDTGVLKERLNALAKRLAELGAKKVVLEDGRWYWDLKPDWKPGEVIEL